MNPPSIFDWMALRDAYERSEHRWAARVEVDDDGTAHIHPLTIAAEGTDRDRVRALEAWVDANWDAPPDAAFSLERDA